jgi:hypothetical protein
MENEENKIVHEDNNQNQKSNSKEEKVNQNKEKDYKNKTVKSFYLFPKVNKSSKESFRSSFNFNNKRSGPLINQQDYDQNLLKKELSSYKTDMHNKKNEILRIKIKYSKLNYENASNKDLIFSILGIPSDKYLTRDQVLDKIENCKLTDIEREKLEDAYERINLKLEITEKKAKINEQNNYIEEIIKNSKIKIIKDLKNDYKTKLEKQREIERNLRKMEEKYDIYEKEVNEMSEYLKELMVNNKKLKNKLEEAKKSSEKHSEEKSKLISENKKLSEDINNKINEYKNTAKRNESLEKKNQG